MYIVYILLSVKYSSRYYIGFTENLQNRLIAHNTSSAGYSSRYAPWEIHTYITFKDEKLARKFEKYLKAGSGQAFLKKRFLAK